MLKQLGKFLTIIAIIFVELNKIYRYNLWKIKKSLINFKSIRTICENLELWNLLNNKIFKNSFAAIR